MVATTLLLCAVRLISLLLLLEGVHDVVGDSDILDLALSQSSSSPKKDHGVTASHIVASHVRLLQPEELVALGTRLYDFLHDQVHPRVA
jgi:hypothetical protein